ncbi:MAG TPA: sigma-54 dependent transcriptional regulator [Planctomycetota bacterium]
MSSAPDASAPRLLYVEDDAATAHLAKALAEKEGFAVRISTTAKDFLKKMVEDPPDLCLLDLGLPDMAGLDLLREVREKWPAIPAVVVTGSESVQDAIASMKLGAAEYVSKPLDAHRFNTSLRNALLVSQQRNEISRLRVVVRSENSPELLLGSSKPMEALRALLRKVGPSDATVLVLGDNGTGKELVARTLHYASARHDKPFVDVNCAALTETLLESELFGHEAGSFTGATGRRRGKFEQAHGGTLFLDEIGDMPLPTQAKMLRALQERTFQRVGGDGKVNVDVRVICATNQNLEDCVAKGTFRKDLFYRVNTIVVEVPPLKARAGDIAELARHFLARAADREKRSIQRIAPGALDQLSRHPWPGNVRELQHAVERAVLVCEGEEILAEHLPPAITRAGASAAAPEPAGTGGLVEEVERLERRLILDALDKHGWVKARAGRALGITERMISYKMENLGIQRSK